MSGVPIDYFDARQRLETAEENFLRKKAKLHRLRTSPNAPHDPAMMKRARSDLNLATNALSAARLAVAAYS